MMSKGLPPAKDVAQKFAQVVRKLREKAGLSQEHLADRAGLHRTFISQIERGLKSPSLNSMAAMARALKIKLSKMVEDIDD